MLVKSLLLATAAATTLTSFLFGNTASSIPESSVWSWSKTDNDVDILKEVNATTVYQCLDWNDTDISDLSDFEVYLVTGDANMDVYDAKKYIDKAARMPDCKGVMFDIEPYCSAEKQWEKSVDNNLAANRINRRNILREFTDSMRECHEYAQSKGVEMRICIPFWYDTLDDGAMVTMLESLIKDGCDGVAVMAYAQGSEKAVTKTEAGFAAKYDKNMETIYEMQTGSGLAPFNTYGEEGEGIQMAIDNYKENFTGTNVGLSWHYMRSLVNLIARDGHLAGYNPGN